MKNTMKTALIIKLTALALTATVLAACGGGDSSSGQEAAYGGGTSAGINPASRGVGSFTTDGVNANGSNYQGEKYESPDASLLK